MSVHKNDERVNTLLEKLNETETFSGEQKEKITSKLTELNDLLSAAGLSINTQIANTHFENLESSIDKIATSINSDNNLIDEYSKDTADDILPTSNTTTEDTNITETSSPNNSPSGNSNSSPSNGSYTYQPNNNTVSYLGTETTQEITTATLTATEVLKENEIETTKENNEKKEEVKEQIENKTFDDFDIENYPKGKSSEDGLKRAVLVAKYLVNNGGFTKEQAAGLAGVFLDENNCDPSGVCYDGGMGIQSWTGTVKSQAMQAYGTNTAICNLSLKEQCDMIIATAKPGAFMNTYYDALKRCQTVEDASATAIVLTGGIGYSTSNQWKTSHPTVQQAQNCINAYIRYNGSSAYTLGAFNRRMENGQKILNILNS